MQQVNIHEAKTHLSRLLEKVSAGEDIIISKAGKPIAKLVRFEPPKSRRRLGGLMKGKIVIADDFDDPLPDDIMAMFEGRDEDLT
jgi:prevent-host-death family protein